MTIARRLTALALLALLLSMSVPASSAQSEGQGWWWRPQTGLLGAQLPPPPDVPQDGLLVERAPDGVTAIAAVRFQLADRETKPVLHLTISSEQGGATAALAACPTGARWTPAQAGAWEFRPQFDCSGARVDGVRADDGSEWTWDLAPLVAADGSIDVVLVDGTATPFRVAFEAPTPASLETTTEPAPAPQGPDPVGPPPPGQDAGQTPPPPTSSPPVFVPPPVSVEPGDQPVPQEPPPEVAQPGSGGQQPVPAQAAPLPAPQPAGLSVLAFALLGAIAALVLVDLVAAGRRGLSPRRLLRPDPEPTGGIGRFSRQRSERAAPLW